MIPERELQKERIRRRCHGSRTGKSAAQEMRDEARAHRLKAKLADSPEKRAYDLRRAKVCEEIGELFERRTRYCICVAPIVLNTRGNH